MTSERDYPTEAELKKLASWKPVIPPEDMNKPVTPAPWYPYFEFVKSIWWSADWGFREEKGGYYLSTAGWSGNEQIIEAMQSNFIFWSMWWQSTRRGGHYIFRFTTDHRDD